MDFLLSILNWFSQNILQKPAFFVGILVLIGYILLKKPWYDVFAGFVKATVGYMILNVASAGLVSTFRPILAALNYRFNIGAAVIDPYFGLTAANNYIMDNFPKFVGTATTALLIGFFLNIFLVAFRKITKVRTLFITGHIMVQQAATVTLMIILLIPSFRNQFWGTLAVGIVCGLYWAVSSNMTVEPTQRLTGGGGFAIGHQQQFAIWFVDKIAPKIGKKEENLDNLKLPTFLNIFHDTVVASATLMLVFFGAILYILGPDIMSNADVITSGTVYNPASQSFFMYVIETSFTFSVYLFILMQGVRMFVAELTNAFQGISSKLLPGSFPAVDVAASFGFGSPSAVLFGFATGLIGQLITILLLIIFKNPVLIITGFVQYFLIMRLSLFTLINVVVGKLRLSFLSYLGLFKWHLAPLRYHFLISVHMVVTMAILTLKFHGFHLLIFSNMLARLVMLLSASSCLQSLKFSLQEQKTRKLTMLVKFSLKSNSLKSKCYL